MTTNKTITFNVTLTIENKSEPTEMEAQYSKQVDSNSRSWINGLAYLSPWVINLLTMMINFFSGG